MSDFLGIKSFAISNAIYMTLKHVERDGLIDEVAEAIDLTADQQLGGRSEDVQERLVTKVLIPLAAKLMEERRAKFITILEAAQHEYPLIRGDKLISGELGEVPRQRQNFSPK